MGFFVNKSYFSNCLHSLNVIMFAFISGRWEMYSPSSLLLSNGLWFVCGGAIIFVEYLLVGLIFSLSVVLFKYDTFDYIARSIPCIFPAFSLFLFIHSSGIQIFNLAFLVVAPLNRNWGVIVNKSVIKPRFNYFYTAHVSFLWFLQ